MAADHTAKLASIVAAYLRKHGFSKTLTAFFRENGETPEEKDIIDLEILYKLYISTQVNEDAKTKKSKKTKLGDTPETENEEVRDNAEEKVNGGVSSDRKKKKKGEKENLVVDSPMVPETGTKKIPKEEGSKKKRKEEKPEAANAITEGLKPKGEKCLPVSGTVKPSVEEALPNGHTARDSAFKKIAVETLVDNGGGLTTQQEAAHPQKSVSKKSKKEKKEQGGEQLPGSETLISKETTLVHNAQASSQDGLSKKKRKKSKDAGPDDAGGEETKDAITAEFVNVQTEKYDAMKPPVESSDAKKKKRRKELEGAGDVNGSIQEPSDAKLEATKNEEELIDSKKQSGKKRKLKEDTNLVNGISNEDHNNSMVSPEKNKETGAGEGAHDCNDVEKHESGSAKTKKHKETPNSKKTPTGALAFQRVEIEKVSFSDPRLSDNSYWAKDGAEEGYGAKAQEVLGLVRGRDFRHEKTKKKRGSYRGGLIGLESHSIKFENSDED